MEKAKAVRDPYFDNVKFVLILLVIFGHVLASNFYYPIERGIYNFIFSFHMPLFVFISGYFTEFNNKKKSIKGIFRIFETLICFQIIHMLLSYAIGKEITLKSIIVPGYTLWYLLSLLCWRIALFITKPSPYSTKTIIISILLFFAMGFVPISTSFSFQRIFFFFPFFLMGFYSKHHDYLNKLPNISISNALLVLSFILLVNVLATTFSIPSFIYDQRLFWGNTPYYNFSYSISFSIIMRFIYLIMATIMSMLVLKTIPHKNTKFTKYGQDTLFFYLYHSILIVLLRFIIRSFSLPTNFGWLIIYALVIITLLIYLRKISFLRFMLNPISNMKKL